MVRVTRARSVSASRSATDDVRRSVGRGWLRGRRGGRGRGRGRAPRRATMRRDETDGLVKACEPFPMLQDLVEAEPGRPQLRGCVLGKGSGEGEHDGFLAFIAQA